MKILVIGLTAIGSFLLVKDIQKEDKKYKVEYTQSEWQARYNWIEVAKAQMRKSDLPSKDVVFICDSLLGKFQNELAAQLQPQFLADTIKTKPKK